MDELKELNFNDVMGNRIEDTTIPYMCKGEPSKRLYVLVNKRLNATYGAVQAGHAVAQWVIEHPKQTWNNQYLIYLWADTDRYLQKFTDLGWDFSAFNEPDLNGTVTAIAIMEDTGLLFQNLELLK